MKYIDDNSKKLYWWNRNYFFAGTILVVILNVLIQAYVKNWDWFNDIGGAKAGRWEAALSFGNLFKHFLSAFMHFNWQHTLLNMLCFLICGAWVERRKGTLPLLSLVFVMAWITEAFAGANNLSTRSFGYSGVNYGFYAYAIIDYCFLMFCKDTRTKINVISGAVLLALIYFAACFSGGTSKVTFEWYPYDFMHNMGHYSGFFGGAILGLTVQFAKLMALKEKRDTRSETKE